MSALSEWSLWLEPDHATASLLRATVDALACVSPASPSFAPHITLYSSIEASEPYEYVLDQVRRVVRQVNLHNDLELRVEAPTTGNTYYQSVLLPLSLSSDLAALRSACGDIWGPVKEYHPHISLKYGDIANERRREIAEHVSAYPASVKVNGISIVRCVGQADEWEVVGLVPLSAD